MESAAGFTLMEMMVTIAIIAIISVVALPSFIGRLPARCLESAAGEVSNAIQIARLTAVKENVQATLLLDVNAESYSITVDGNTVRRGNLPAGVDLMAVNLTGQAVPAAGGLVVFDSRGFPTPPVDVVLQNTTGTTWTIQINLTGSSRLIRG